MLLVSGWCGTEVGEGMGLHLVNCGCMCYRLSHVESPALGPLSPGGCSWGYATYKHGSNAPVVAATLGLRCPNSWVSLEGDSIICGAKISFSRLCQSCIWTYRNLCVVKASDWLSHCWNVCHVLVLALS